MDRFDSFLGLLAIVTALIVSIRAWSATAKAERKTTDLAERLRTLEWRLRLLTEQTQAHPHEEAAPAEARTETEAERASSASSDGEDLLATRLAARKAQSPTEETTQATSGAAKPPVVAPPPLPAPIPTFATAESAHAATKPNEAFRPAYSKTSSHETLPRRKSPLENINWEQLMGVRLFAWLGGLALFLAAAFFLKYSFEHDLIPPAMRVAMGYATGIGLLIGGVRLSQKRYKITADTLSATGVVILYAVTFACRVVYHFAPFGVTTTFLLMTLITAVAFVIAVKLDAIVVAILGMLGGFLTPILLSTGQDNPFGLFSYIALLDIGLLAVAFARRWDWLPLAGAIGTFAMQFGWVFSFFNPGKVFIAMAIFLIFCALCLVSAWWSHRRERSNLWLIGATLLMPAATFLFTLHLIADDVIGLRPGVVFSFIVGADFAVLALATLHSKAIINPAQPVASSAANSVLPTTTAVTIPSLTWLNAIAGGIVFLLLAIWTGLRVDETLLLWALGGSVALAALHTAYPIALRWLHPDEPVPGWTQLFPVVALAVMLIPILRLEDVSFVLWLFVLLIDLLAIVVAVVAASIVGIALSLVVTAGVAFVWLMRIPAEMTALPEMLIVLALMAGVFTAAGVIAGQMILSRQEKNKDAGHRDWLPDGWSAAEVQRQLPAISGILPFLLLLVVTDRLPLINPSPVFATAFLLSALLLGLNRIFKLSSLPAVGLGCSFLVELGWHGRHFVAGNPTIAVAWYSIFFLIFAAYPFIFHQGDDAQLVAWISSALSGPLHFWLVYDATKRAWPNDHMGIVPAIFAVPALLALVMAIKQFPVGHPKRNVILSWFGGVALLFLTLILPIQLKHEWLTIGWALEGAALLWLLRKVPHEGLKFAGVGFLVVAFARLAFNPAVLGYHPRSAVPVFNWYFYTYGLVIAATYTGARLLAPPKQRLLQQDARPLLVTLGTILAFILMNIEIADYFTNVGKPVLTLSFRVNFARDMSYTIGWALFAFVMLVVGILKRVRAARWAGIGLLAVTLLKLFLHDLAALNQLYRVGALVGVAVVAIIASFLYQKFMASGDGGSDQPAPANDG